MISTRFFTTNSPSDVSISGLLPPHISKDVLPMLRERGMSEDQLRQMLVETPRRYFE